MIVYPSAAFRTIQNMHTVSAQKPKSDVSAWIYVSLSEVKVNRVCTCEASGDIQKEN